MTRKDYVAIAEVIRTTLADAQLERIKVVDGLVPVLKADNLAFQADKFAAACNVPAIYGY